MQIGSDAHKELFCRSFLETHLKYEPEDLPWPDLHREELKRLRAIPFWTEAVTTDREAGRMVPACAEASDDPLVREAIALQGYEEARHGRILQHMIDLYDLEVEDRPAPVIPADVESAFMDFGYGECLDSFGAFGVYALARRVEYLSEPILSIFENVVQEEANHIVFFVNWSAWLQPLRLSLFVLTGGLGWGVRKATLAQMLGFDLQIFEKVSFDNFSNFTALARLVNFYFESL